MRNSLAAKQHEPGTALLRHKGYLPAIPLAIPAHAVERGANSVARAALALGRREMSR